MSRISVKPLSLLFLIIFFFVSCEEESDYRDRITGIYQCNCQHKGFYYNGVHHNNYIELQTSEEISIEKTAIDNDSIIIVNHFGSAVIYKDYAFWDNLNSLKFDLRGQFFLDSDSLSFGGYNFSGGPQIDSIAFSRDHTYYCAGKRK